MNDQKVHFYHNPQCEILTISEEVKIVDIYNVNGSILKRMGTPNQGSFEISTNEFNRGVYFIKMNLLSGEIRTDKFFK
ncbi:T9SS type A sorting domain-containing protein [Bacteroidota bacterium]